MKQPKARLDAWTDAQKRFHLSDLPIQMARELGLNPKQCGEDSPTIGRSPWKLPPPEFMAACYVQRFHRERPVKVVPLAEVTKRQELSGPRQGQTPTRTYRHLRPPGGNRPRAASRRLRSAPLCRAASLPGCVARLLWRAGPEATRQR